jgi:NAD(P)-dependent dehydrogenase (short-subunit alcohol dehydrogenase family)
MDQIKETNPKIDVMIVPLNLSDNSLVRRAAKTINSSIDRLDVLVNNAGVMAIKDYTKSADGFEMNFASNHLGHFLLTNLLMSKILAANGVAINISSTGHELAEFNFEDPNFQVSENEKQLTHRLSDIETTLC